ncbi:MAG TPA: tetratricopeptide repeat protein [Terriglobales bacterium]|nr:tetratricopeptide repeat protein [Terriglobales bacterium]
MFTRNPTTGCVIVLLAAGCVAQEHQHGRNERLGSVHFVTGCSAEAQKEFDRAVALLHSFQFNHAIQGFNAALKRDPSCAMAHWGIALSQWSNPFAAGLKDTSQLEAGRQSAERGKAATAKSERERAYIAAVAKLYSNFELTPQKARLVAYRDAMEDLASRYPDDREAQIFYALALAAAEEPTDKNYAARLKAGGILEKLFRDEPNHPGLAHYIIHTYDVPPLAGKALVAARRYSDIAPDAPHALHMPSHTFTRVGYWQDSIDANRAAAAASRRVGQTAEELHASDYLVYAYLQIAQDEAARKVLQALPEIASRFDPKIVVSGAAGPDTGYFALAAIPARFAVERRDWQRAAELEPHETPFPYTEAMTWFARGMAAARLHDLPKAQASIAALQEIRARLEKANQSYWAEQAEIQGLEVNAWSLFAEGRKELALTMITSAAEMEDNTEKLAITPGPLAPAREMMGEMLLELKQPTQALEQFEATLKQEPNRFRALYGAGRAAQLSGKMEASRKYFAELLRICEHADKPRRDEILAAEKTVLAH